jgi:glycerol-3-phosphate dehydrogenase
LIGGNVRNLEALLKQAIAEAPNGINVNTIERLVTHYGSEYGRLFGLCVDKPSRARLVDGSQDCITAEIVQAAREEMAVTLGDIVFRRTGLGNLGHPGDRCLMDCAYTAAEELGWDTSRINAEVESVQREFSANLPFFDHVEETHA